MNSVSLPDEVFAALSRFLGPITALTSPEPTKEEPPPKLYPISDDDSEELGPRVPPISMQHNRQEDSSYRCTINGPNGRQNTPPGVQRSVSPSCSKNKDYAGCSSPKCPNDQPFGQEETPVYPCQDQAVRNQMMQQNQSPLNRSQQCPSRSPRSQSMPRTNATDRYDSVKYDCPREQERINSPRGRCALRTACEGDAPTGSYGPDITSRGMANSDWNNSSQVGSNYGDWQRRQLRMQQQQQQQQQRQCQYRQQQANKCNMNWLEDDDISVFAPDFNSTMMDKTEKGCQLSTKNGQQQQQMPRQFAACKKSGTSQSQSPRTCIDSPEMPRRHIQYESSPMESRQSKWESQPMQGRKPQQYETLLNETSYVQLPEALRDGQRRPNVDKKEYQNVSEGIIKCKVNTCNPNADTSHMNQTKQCQRSPRSHSLNSPNYRSQGAISRGTQFANEKGYTNQSKQCQRGPRSPALSPINSPNYRSQGTSCGNICTMDNGHMNQTKQCQRSPRSPSLSPMNCPNYKSQGAISRGNQSTMDNGHMNQTKQCTWGPESPSISSMNCPNYRSQAVRSISRGNQSSMDNGYINQPKQCQRSQNSPSVSSINCPNYRSQGVKTTSWGDNSSMDNRHCQRSPRSPSCSPMNCPSYRSRGNNSSMDTGYVNQTKQCQRGPRSPSLSPMNCTNYRSQGVKSTACGSDSPMDMHKTDSYPEYTNSCRSAKYSEMSRAFLDRSCPNETTLDKTNCNSSYGGRSTKIRVKTPEERLAERTQAELFEALVKDQSCPGVIQSSLNGTENFNEYAFDIAFAGPIPNKPFPLDPMSMLEAIKLRIDYERDEIRKRQQRPAGTEDIESYFEGKNKSQVNEGVAGFLKAESQYRQSGPPDSAFGAQINTLETNMFDERVMLNVYSATTQPVQE